MVERLFLAVPRVCLQFVIVVFRDHTHLLFLILAQGQVKENIRIYQECEGGIVEKSTPRTTV